MQDEAEEIGNDSPCKAKDFHFIPMTIIDFGGIINK